MKAQEELNYLALIVQDHINTLAPSSKVAVQERAQQALNAVVAGLTEPEVTHDEKAPPAGP